LKQTYISIAQSASYLWITLRCFWFTWHQRLTVIKHWNVMKCTFLLFEISDLSDNDLKMTYLCSNYEWWKLYWKM